MNKKKGFLLFSMFRKNVRWVKKGGRAKGITLHFYFFPLPLLFVFRNGTGRAFNPFFQFLVSGSKHRRACGKILARGGLICTYLPSQLFNLPTYLPTYLPIYLAFSFFFSFLPKS